MLVKNKTLVIGAGFGGIASALRMKALGHDVTIIDRLNNIGGRAQVFKKGNYKHDAGPTVITAPFLFDELFSLFGEDRRNYLNFVPLNPWYRFYFDNGMEFDYANSIDEMNKEIAKFNLDDINNYKNLIKQSEKIFEVGFEQLSDKPFTRFSDMIKVIPNLFKLKSFLTVSQLVNLYIKNKFLRRAFSIHPLLVGGNPFDTTSIYALIHFLERKWGIYFCMGGTGKLVYELKCLLERNDVEIILNTDIVKINTERGIATSAVSSKGGIYDCNRIIFNGDPPILYEEILKTKRNFFLNMFKREKYSMGLFVLFFGTKINYPKIAHHTIWLGKRFKSLLNDIFNKKILPNDFSLYIHRPTATDKTFAPKGHESFYVLCPVPNLQGNINWNIEGPRLQKRIIKALAKTIMPNLSKVIEDVFYMTPNDFKNDYRSMHGAGFSISPIFSQSAWFRYHNKDRKIKNLYISAAGAHPGAGIPGVLSSAKVVEKLVKIEMNNESK